MIPIRVTFSEKNEIRNKERKVQRDISTLMREKPDKKVYVKSKK